MELEADAELDVEVDARPESDRESEIGAFPITLHFMERIRLFSWYGEHRLLVGPSGSTNPEEAAWTELADGTEMDNPAAGDQWAQGFVADLSDQAGESVRIAFHYRGQNGDIWYLDDLCLALTADPGFPTTCHWEERFDGVTLPGEWSSVAGSGNAPGSGDWEIVSNSYTPNPPAVRIFYDSSDHQDRYLVSPPFDLPAAGDAGTD